MQLVRAKLKLQFLCVCACVGVWVGVSVCGWHATIVKSVVQLARPLITITIKDLCSLSTILYPYSIYTKNGVCCSCHCCCCC